MRQVLPSFSDAPGFVLQYLRPGELVLQFAVGVLAEIWWKSLPGLRRTQALVAATSQRLLLSEREKNRQRDRLEAIPWREFQQVATRTRLTGSELLLSAHDGRWTRRLLLADRGAALGIVDTWQLYRGAPPSSKSLPNLIPSPSSALRRG